MNPTADSVPDGTRSNTLRGESSIHHASESRSFAPQFTAVPPPQQMGDVRGIDGRKRRAVGLIPAVAGAQFPLVIKDKPTERVSPREVGLIKAELRKADASSVRLETALVEATLSHGADSEQAKAKLKESREAVDRAAIFRRRLAEAESASKGRPTQVHLATVHEPSEVIDALENVGSPPVVACLHDGCRGRTWSDEAEMRQHHPTNAEMQRTQQAHVYVYLSDAPADSLDPDGPKIGYIAPIGRDGFTVQQAAAMADDSSESDRDRIDVLSKGLADAMALIAELTEKAKKKG